jgi:ribosome-binding protein aMBF1 (putative translation factor)
MANVVRRYKAKRRWDNATLAEKISAQEHMLAQV